MKLVLELLEDRFAVCRMDADAIIPAMLLIPGQEFVSVSRTSDELSVVCPESLAPAGAKTAEGWRVFKLMGPLDFALTGVLSSLLVPLADARISVFTIATFDTDYILVQEENLAAAKAVLERHSELMK
jgi:hypothetical protein